VLFSGDQCLEAKRRFLCLTPNKALDFGSTNLHSMENISDLAQLIVSISILIVWVFRYDNIVSEFKQYGLSDLVRNLVGASKIALATVLAVGVWYEVPLVPASLMMAFLMICAQGFHVKVKNPFHKYVPSALLLLLSLFIAAFNYGLI
jgi:hypothetical protein